MRRSRKPIVIASRRSRLARVQAEMIGAALARLHPNVEVRYHWIESEGDRHTGVMLAQHGGKGLFTGAIERALLAGEADLAVHSLKDLPAEETSGLAIAAIPRRADVRDVLITREGFSNVEQLPQGALFGTSSPRRMAQALRQRPDLKVALLRGNVDTRLRRVLDHAPAADRPGHLPRYDATLLAYAGLARLGMKEHLAHAIPVDVMLPAACQGALAVQCRTDDHVTLTRCLPLNDPATATAVHAERGVVAALEADCHSPICVLAEPAAPPEGGAKAVRNADAHRFRLRVRVLSPDGRQMIEADQTVKTRELRRVVKSVVRDLESRGARDILAAAKGFTLHLPESAAAEALVPARAG